MSRIPRMLALLALVLAVVSIFVPGVAGVPLLALAVMFLALALLG